MFRLFRRKKKEKKEEIVERKEIEDVSSRSSTQEIVSEEISEPEAQIYEQTETPFEEKFARYSKILPEDLLEDVKPPTKPSQEILPLIQSVLEKNTSIYHFISPAIIKQKWKLSEEHVDYYPLYQEDLPPVSLEERIEGALFSIGRPIHVNELIENFEEDSPTIKRAIRRLSRKKRRTEALVVEEISKDRWVLQLNPIYHEFFQPIKPELFMLPDERRVLTEIAYRQPISLALLKKLIRGIGPIKITEICQKLEDNGFILSETRARSIIYTSTPKFAKGFGFDNESRRLKLQMLWRLKRLIGDFEAEEEEEEDLDEDQEEDLEVEPEIETFHPSSEIDQSKVNTQVVGLTDEVENPIANHGSSLDEELSKLEDQESIPVEDQISIEKSVLPEPEKSTSISPIMDEEKIDNEEIDTSGRQNNILGEDQERRVISEEVEFQMEPEIERNEVNLIEELVYDQTENDVSPLQLEPKEPITTREELHRDNSTIEKTEIKSQIDLEEEE